MRRSRNPPYSYKAVRRPRPLYCNRNRRPPVRSPEHICCSLRRGSRRRSGTILSRFGFRAASASREDRQGDYAQGTRTFRFRGGRHGVDGEDARLPLGNYKAVAAAPLSEAGFTPDMVVLEEGPERIMWLSLASIYFKSGRHSWSSSVFHASCVDVTVVPYVTGKPNVCFRLLRLQGCHRPRRRRGTDRDILHPAGRDHKALKWLSLKAIP